MLRRNFVAALASLFVIKKLPKVKEEYNPNVVADNPFFTLPGKEADYYYHSQFKQWSRIKAAEEIDVGALVKIDAATGMAKQCHVASHDHIIGVCMVNNWPEDVVVALYD